MGHDNLTRWQAVVNYAELATKMYVFFFETCTYHPFRTEEAGCFMFQKNNNVSSEMKREI